MLHDVVKKLLPIVAPLQGHNNNLISPLELSRFVNEETSLRWFYGFALQFDSVSFIGRRFQVGEFTRLWSFVASVFYIYRTPYDSKMIKF